MVLNFALSLSFDGIVLLHRVRNGWAPIGSVPLDTDDLDGAMQALRERGLAIRQGARRVGLIIPNEQIRYLDMPDPGGDESARETAIRKALDGATPYAVDHLAFDHSRQDRRLLIAAVARETLNEAEAFAIEHGFKPAAFMAIAPEDAFNGAVFFGVPGSWNGPNTPERPVEAIVVLPEGSWTPAPDDEPARAAPTTADETASQAATDGDITASPAPEPSAPAPGTDSPERAEDAPQAPAVTVTGAANPHETQAQAQPREPEVAVPPTKPPAPAPQPDAQALPVAQPPAPAPAGPQPQAPVAARRDPAAPPAKPSFSSIRATRDDGGSAPKLGAPVAADPGSERRFTPVEDRSGALRDSGITADRIETTERGSAAAAAMRFLSRRKDDSGTEDSEPEVEVAPVPPVKPVVQPEPDPVPQMPVAARQKAVAPSARSGGARTGLGRFAAYRADRSVDAAPSARMAGGAAVIDATTASGFATTSDDERTRMTVFGARNRDQIGGKPRFLGLMLTAALLLFLIGVAAWASVFLDDGLARLFRPSAEPPAVAALPVAEPAAQGTEVAPAAISLPDTALSPAPEEADEAEDLRVAALDTMVDTDEAPALTEPRDIRALSPEEADATYAATGIWQRAPASPLEPPSGGTDDIYVASIDPGVRQFDAVALPNRLTIAPEAGIEDPGLPPPSDMVFDFDDRGLIRATPEGALSPEGLRIFTGRPAAVPPLRREAALSAPGATQSDTAPDATLGGVRPEARPADIIEQFERAELGGNSREELAAMRPVMRPRTVQEDAAAAEPDAPATAQAVARSLIPMQRPRNMEAIVQRAAREPERTEEVQVAAAATVAPRVVQPSAPSSANVAQAATVRNAIRLNQVNLIGVYGTPNNRRALVRMPNGRYEKVKIGDRLDGGRVTAIGETALQYQKSGRTVTLDMPRG